MTQEIKNNVVVITGASRGLGLTIAQELAKSGFRAVAIARNESEHLKKAQTELGENLQFCRWDLGKLESLPRLARQLRSEFGPIYGLVNNVGIGSHGLLATMPDSSIEELVRMNMLSPILLTKYLMRSMLSRRSGREWGEVLGIGNPSLRTDSRSLVQPHCLRKIP